MKKCLLLLAFIAGQAHSAGILTFKEPLASTLDNKTEFALFVSEPLNSKTTYQSWTGFTFGESTLKKSEHCLLYKINKMVEIGPYLGVGVDSSKPSGKQSEQYGGAILQMRLWE